MKTTGQMAETSCKAWLLPVGACQVAIGEFEMAHIIAGWQRYLPVPRSPAWCRHVFMWQGRLLPLFDLEVYLDPARANISSSSPGTREIVGVIAYEDQGGVIHYGGLKLSAPPVIRVVTDEEMCDYPAGYPGWDRIALSCFEDPGIGQVPILDIARIFCTRADLATTTNSTDQQP